MPRKVKSSARNSREYTRHSATTFETIPSGVTLDAQGITYTSGSIISPTELGYLDGQAGYGVAYTPAAGYGVSAEVNAWGGATITAIHGFTNALTGFSAIYSSSLPFSSVSPVACQIIHWAGGDTNGQVSVAAVVEFNSGAQTQLQPSGGSIYWMAFGY